MNMHNNTFSSCKQKKNTNLKIQTINFIFNFCNFFLMMFWVEGNGNESILKSNFLLIFPLKNN